MGNLIAPPALVAGWLFDQIKIDGHFTPTHRRTPKRHIWPRLEVAKLHLVLQQNHELYLQLGRTSQHTMKLYHTSRSSV